MKYCKIINNKPVCGKCRSEKLSPVREYKEVQYKGRFAIMFIKRCYDCNEDVAYLVTEVPLEGDNIRKEITDSIIEVVENYDEGNKKL